ncbi:MAG TPA: group 1 truncated hemoglobin [Burkholderiaceae bacterium]
MKLTLMPAMTKVAHLLCIAVIGMAPVTAQAQAASETVYRAMGGQEGIKLIVDDFLRIVLADDRIKKTLEDADIEHLSMRLNEQFCELSGGPCKYGGKDMKTIHADLHITNAQFNALTEDLQLAMEKHGVPSREQNKLIAKLAPMQHGIVTK